MVCPGIVGPFPTKGIAEENRIRGEMEMSLLHTTCVALLLLVTALLPRSLR